MAKRDSLEATHPPSRPPPGLIGVNPNLLLAALPTAVYQRVFPELTRRSAKINTFLHTVGQPIDRVVFPGDGFISEVTVLKDGKMVEIATIGREGMVGLAASRHGQLAICSSMVQAHMDVCFQMPAVAFQHEMARRDAFFDLLSDYGTAHLGFVGQSTACNIAHSVEQRLARWLLLAHDRIGRDEFPLTQEFVAIMLGATRQTVAVTAGILQRAGFIKYHRGHMVIQDREQLEAAACECYDVTTALLTGVLDRARERNSSEAVLAS
jgi:CRP-like cAMP-binding protein